MMNSSNKYNRILSDVLFAGIVLVIVFCFFMKCYTVVSVNQPRELREANMMAIAKAFADGINPYSLETIDAEIPGVTSVYGFLVPLLLSPTVFLAQRFNLSIMISCELVTLAIEIVGVIVAGMLVYKRTESKPIAGAAALAIYGCFWRYLPCGGAFADQWGLSLLFIIFLVMSSTKYDEDVTSIVGASLFVFLFYIKHYFLFAVIGTSVYLLIKDIKLFIKFALTGIILGVTSICIVDHIFPFYFSEVFPISRGSANSDSLSYSLLQIKDTARNSFLAISLIFGIILILMIFKSDLRKRLIRDHIFLVCVCSFPLVICIGMNMGTLYSYYYQMFWPFIILLVFSYYKEMMGILKIDSSSLPYSTITLFFILLVAWQCKGLLVSFPKSEQEISEWNESVNILSEYKKQGDVLCPALYSSVCLEQNIPTAEYGQHQFNNSYCLENWQNSRLWSSLFPETELILRRGIEYDAEVFDNVKNQKYSLIIWSDAANYGLTEEDISSAGYEKVDSYIFSIGWSLWNVSFWA